VVLELCQRARDHGARDGAADGARVRCGEARRVQLQPRVQVREPLERREQRALRHREGVPGGGGGGGVGGGWPRSWCERIVGGGGVEQGRGVAR
jgi:hypothetical protein